MWELWERLYVINESFCKAKNHFETQMSIYQHIYFTSYNFSSMFLKAKHSYKEILNIENFPRWCYKTEKFVPKLDIIVWYLQATEIVKEMHIWDWFPCIDR